MRKKIKTKLVLEEAQLSHTKRGSKTFQALGGGEGQAAVCRRAEPGW